MKILIMQLSPNSYHFLLLIPNILPSLLFSSILSHIFLWETKFCSRAIQQLALHTECGIPIFLFSESRQEDKTF